MCDAHFENLGKIVLMIFKGFKSQYELTLVFASCLYSHRCTCSHAPWIQLVMSSYDHAKTSLYSFDNSTIVVFSGGSISLATLTGCSSSTVPMFTFTIVDVFTCWDTARFPIQCLLSMSEFPDGFLVWFDDVFFFSGYIRAATSPNWF